MTKTHVPLTSNHLLYVTDWLNNGTRPIKIMKRATAFPELNRSRMFVVLAPFSMGVTRPLLAGESGMRAGNRTFWAVSPSSALCQPIWRKGKLTRCPAHEPLRG